jgi:hypothetical protein
MKRGARRDRRSVGVMPSLAPAVRLVVTLLFATTLAGCAGLRQSLANQPCVLNAAVPYTVVEAVPGVHEIRRYRLVDEPFTSL